LVTLNFPKRTMYLQRRSGEPFADEGISATNVNASSKEAGEFLKSLKKQGQWPGSLKVDDVGKVTAWMSNTNPLEIYPLSRLFIFTKKSDNSKYHYDIVQTSKDSAWKLQRAWQTDASGRFLQEFPVP
jgi:hypothetical protein